MAASQIDAARIGPKSGTARAERTDILLVGLGPRERETVPSRLFGALAPGARSVGFDALDPERVHGAMVVLSPLVAPEFDAFELAERLGALGFTGRYVAYATDVAHEAVIRADVAEVAPSLAFDLVAMGRGPRLATS
ncbi:hypothetical protein [Jannaschia sp. W003]|uniref:hypothetical protein n=1 Tax=Jannaschia sp. W003 TaxID=2867012 RepID=UPI0021A4A751|nr:hypothetical protein [Jannaschia sp. W003]UWQ20479.1 hypothetical protein K3554_10815 [Jannaschia sp. W003]